MYVGNVLWNVKIKSPLKTDQKIASDITPKKGRRFDLRTKKNGLRRNEKKNLSKIKIGLRFGQK